MYKNIGANRISHTFIKIFQNVLKIRAPLKKIVKKVKTKKERNKWLSKNCVFSLMKSILYSMNRKKDPNQELFNSYKVIRNNVNKRLRKSSDDYTKHFFENLPTSEEQWKFIKNKINSNKPTEKIPKLKECHTVISDEKSIANCLNNCFARLGFYKGKIIAPKLPAFNLREMNSISGRYPEENYTKLFY